MLFKNIFSSAVLLASTLATTAIAAPVDTPPALVRNGTERDRMMASDNNVYFANAANQNIYVMASLNPDWAIVDFITDVGLMFVGIEEIKAATTATELPRTIKTMRDLYNFFKIAGTLVSGTAAAGTRLPEAFLALVEGFKKNSILIPPVQFKDVKEEGALSIYLSADGIASIFGASNVSLMVMSEDGKQISMFNTNSDYSWIATNREQIVRSVYGKVWQEDPRAGEIYWPRE